MNDTDIKKMFQEADQYMEDLIKNPGKRMEQVRLSDKVFFLKPDAEKKDLWNCGYAEVVGIENKDGLQKNTCKSAEIKSLFLKSESYPFSVYVDLQHVLVNYTDQKRKQEENDNEQ